MPPTGKPAPGTRRRWGSHRRRARVGDGKRGAMTRLTSASSRASSPALALLSFQTSHPTPPPHLAPPGGRWRKRALPGNAGARWGGRCLLDRVSFGRLLLAVSAEGSSAAAAAFGASTYPSLTLAEMGRRRAFCLTESTVSLPRRDGGCPRGGTFAQVCAPSRTRAMETSLGPGIPADARAQPPGAPRSPPRPRACPRPFSRLARIKSPFPGFRVLRYRDTLVQWEAGGGGCRSPAVLRLLPAQGCASLSAPLSLLLNPKSRSCSPIWERLYLTCWLLVSVLLFTEF